VIDRVKSSTNEVGGRVLELSGARYFVRGLGYLRSLSDLENVPVGAKNGTPVLVKDLGVVTFGPDIREGVAEWNGQGETVGGIVVMRYGLNALNVIEGVKNKLEEIKSSLPPGVEIVAGYDRSRLIGESIQTLQRDLIEEAIIVSLVIVVFLFHFRSALIPIISLPIAVIATFIPMYYLHVSSNIMSLGGLALAIGVLVDAAIVMVENGYRQLSEHPVEWTRTTHSDRCGQTSRSSTVLLVDHHCGVLPARISPRSTGRPHVRAACAHEDFCRGFFLDSCNHPRSCIDDHLH